MTLAGHTLKGISYPAPLSADLSVLAFQQRVLALAEDSATPLRARLRFISIVASNLDEFYMVRMPRLRRDAASASGRAETGELSPTACLARAESMIASLLREQQRCAGDCLSAAREYGVHILQWQDLSAAEQHELREYCREELHPALTPLAMTLSPGHPLPHLPHLGLSLAIVLRRDSDDLPHLAELEIPHDVARMHAVPGREGAVIMLEELLRANADLFHPHARVESVHLFRVTRGGDLSLDEVTADDLLDAVDVATQRRAYNPAVRVEIERDTPPFVANLILESLRRDARVQGAEIELGELQVIEGLLDLRCVTDLPLPDVPLADYPALNEAHPVDDEMRMFDAIRQRDLLVHHPFESFDGTVVRFLREAAEDPDVTTIKITLYRVGDPSPVVAALLAAVSNGKRVFAFVELQARFDEEHNVTWARALERAGGHVVYGIVGVKTHAKVAMVVRKENGKSRRYVHVGTGNYNPRSGRQYTDLSLFTANDEIGADVADLFNALTGSSEAPRGLTRGALVAPRQLLPAILMLIEREASNARNAKPASIAIKVNGLSDPDVVRALYDASEDGVDVKLVVRGICTLRPGVRDRSSRIRVISIVGRLLEHSRIYRFANGGDPEYLIGSSDLRPRNLRRRVELLAPIWDSTLKESLDRILDCYIHDPTAWSMQSDGSYVRA